MSSGTHTISLTNLSNDRAPMTAARKTALTAGILYLLTFISIPTLALYNTVRAPLYILSTGQDTTVIFGTILEMIVALAGIGTAVVLYPVLKKQNKSAALGLVGSRVLEAATIFVGVALLLSVVALKQAGVGAEGLVIARTQMIMYDRMFLVGQSFMPAVNDLLLGFLLFHSRLVPRALAVIGIAGGVVLLAGDVAVMFGILGQHAPSTSLAAVPVALFEFSLGVYFVVKGFLSRAAS